VGFGVDPTNSINISDQPQDWSDTDLLRAPKFSGNAGFDYKIPTDFGTLAINSTLSFTSSYLMVGSLFGPLAPPDLRRKERYKQDGYALLSAQVSWTDLSDHFSVTVFGDNLTNKRHFTTFAGGPFGDYSPIADPITYGIRVGYKF
jgi:iron complex outermembrane receptor protein